MAFDSLSEKLQNVFKNLRSKGRLTEDDAKTALKEVKMALLEADVNFRVVKKFVKDVQERAIGQDVMSGLNPGQMVIKIVNEEMVKLMGSETTEIAFRPGKELTVIMMVGLQGAGKTTTTAKIAGKLKTKGKKTLLAACDVYRPAAIEQLQINGEKQGVEVFSMGNKNKPADIAKAAVEHAKKEDCNVLIIDTAGRLHVDEEMMDELVEIKEAVDVFQTILVVDAMTGQDAVNVASTFNDKIGIDGVVLTKLDGDTRGGAALSIRAVTGKPILYAGMGEKLSDLEQFYPDRMASRILGMGDVLTMIEKAQENLDEEKAKELEQKMRKNEFDFERYNNSQNKDKQGIILFSITKHNDQEREAQKVSKRINNSFYEHNQFKYVNEKKSKNIEIISVVNKNTQENNMTFRSLDFDDKQIIYQEVLTKEQSEQIHTFIQKSEPFILSGIAGSGKTISTVKLIPDMVEKIKNMGSDSKILYVTFSNNLKRPIAKS